MPRSISSEPIILRPGYVAIPEDLLKLRGAADLVTNGIIHEATSSSLEWTSNPAYREERDRANNQSTQFALRLREAVYGVQTSYDLKEFYLSLQGIWKNDLQIPLITRHLLDPESRRVELSPSTSIQQTRIPDILWLEQSDRQRASYVNLVAIGRGGFRNDWHGFPKLLRLPATTS